ncbi:hypothetical protein GobsT_26880 [Gemmata obscuriglobus]|nr:hypothetical protein GobsT_26880 [Gemmata obscuriglobus]VTS05374.1 Transposase OS=Azospirillum sp. (strain B510) GN=AZL_b00860 PE=4 SV=1: MULE [Gemmata obscuriglobus UQM 2246]
MKTAKTAEPTITRDLTPERAACPHCAVLSGHILLAKGLLSARNQDLAALLSAVKGACGVPVAGAISDGQHSIRKAVAQALPGVPYQLCQFHYLRAAAKPIYEADRHAEQGCARV